MLEKKRADFLMEVSWEVCNKIGGIHTVISSKANIQSQNINKEHIFIGPDLIEKNNTEFIECDDLYESWKKEAISDSFNIRIGYWNIPSRPIVILLEFTSFYKHKDSIFKELWENNKLDSLNGGWDYIEPAIFGYIAGKLIKHFTDYNIPHNKRAVAHFHEWMTGAGVLYLSENANYIATVFTTHATVLGRSIMGNNVQIPENFVEHDFVKIAQNLGLTSKHSLEVLSAKKANCFTTVSRLTAIECEKYLGVKPDIITPNAFDVPLIFKGDKIINARKQAREKILQVSNALTGKNFDNNSKIIISSGRYEYTNKGYDKYLDSIHEISKRELKGIKIIALCLIPSNQCGARKDLQENISKNKYTKLDKAYITHRVAHPTEDPIIKKIEEFNLDSNSNISIIFVPAYLNGKDKIFDLDYYNILSASDLTIFPSKYEPWGYTPMESIALNIPTITTDITGFGDWAKDKSSFQNGVNVLTDYTKHEDTAYLKIADIIENICTADKKTTALIKQNAGLVSKEAIWDKFIYHYTEAHIFALSKVQFNKREISKLIQFKHISRANNFKWKQIHVNTSIPEKIKGLLEMSYNIWTTWDHQAEDLFCTIDTRYKTKYKSNPLALLNDLSQTRLEQMTEDAVFLEKYVKVYSKFTDYISKKKTGTAIAYFSMEYGIDSNIHIYSGGLGILAGDYLKEASNQNTNITAIGLMYKYGYFEQEISISNEQRAVYNRQDFENLPLEAVKDENKNNIYIKIQLPGRFVYASIWKINVGRVSLYLLDTDIDKNKEADRTLSHKLYGGDNEHRLKQEILLGIGGIRALKALNIEPNIYHCNEGHAAFVSLERLSNLVKDNVLNFDEALEYVKSSSLFTTHTPVPAGHDSFNEDLMRTYFRIIPKKLNIRWETFISLGRYNRNDINENFSMSVLAANTSMFINGVSKIHGDVSKEIFSELYPGYLKEESHIDYVTNGVHFETWASKEIKELLITEIDPNFIEKTSNNDLWNKIYSIQNEKIWNVKIRLKQILIDYIHLRFSEDWIKRYEDPSKLSRILDTISTKNLSLGFARRFATYKRALIIFSDINRLRKIINNPDMPVQIIFAGKSHPNDGGGKDLIKKIIEYSKQEEFLGKIIFVEDYDIELAKCLISGVDVWVNTPTRLKEASGTSGEKALMNGTLNFSVLDGWWCEGYKKNCGWALSQEKTYEKQELQDRLDANSIYTILEKNIIPLFYKRDDNNIPNEWIEHIKNSMVKLAPQFTTQRMLADYESKFYSVLAEREILMKHNNYYNCIEIAFWKQKILRNWQSIKTISIESNISEDSNILANKEQNTSIKIYIGNNDIDDLGVELVSSYINKNTERKLVDIKDMKMINIENKIATFNIKTSISKPKTYEIGIRLYPKHKLLPFRQHFNYVKWL